MQGDEHSDSWLVPLVSDEGIGSEKAIVEDESPFIQPYKERCDDRNAGTLPVTACMNQLNEVLAIEMTYIEKPLPLLKIRKDFQFLGE